MRPDSALRALFGGSVCGLLLAACGLAVNGLDTNRGDAGGPRLLDASALDVDVGDDSTGANVDAAEASTAEGATEAGAVLPPDFAWYVLDETSGTTAHDSTSNHYDVTDLAGVTWGSGASFDGTGGGGSVQVAAGLRQAPVSFTAWLTPDSRVDEAANSYGITPFPPNAVSGDVAQQYGFGIGLNVWSGASAFAIEDVGYDFQSIGGAAFAAGTEYFVAAAIGTASASAYVDGQLVGQATTSVPGPAATTTLALGFHNNDPGYGTKRFFAGRMRDVRVYKRVLDPGAVAELYVAGPAVSGP
jgi:hypothetical protein